MSSPARPACACVPALPLQLLVRQHPAWRAHPVAVVDEDRPQGVVQWVNERALRRRILPGMRFAEALALDATLLAGAVDPLAVVAALDEVVEALRAFSPTIETCPTEPGVLWLDARGLEGLFPSLEAWAADVLATLRGLEFTGSVVVGFDRFDAYALARTRRGAHVLTDADAERRAADRVPLHRIHLDPHLRDTMLRLGVDDVGGLRRLRREDLRARFATAGIQQPDATPRPLRTPAQARHDLDPGTHGLDRSALLFLVKQQLAGVSAILATRGQAIAILHLELHLEKGGKALCRVQPATPTLDAVQLIELLNLRLDTLTLVGEIEGFDLRAEAGAASAEQLQLFGMNQRRDLAAGNRALARLRAELGDDAVQRAHLADGHLPEAQVRWLRCEALRHPEPRPALQQTLVRRALTCPLALPHQHAGPDGWFAGNLNFGPVQNMFGPHVIAGGWWRRAVHRDYHFAETRRGDLLWIFYDRVRQRWCSHGAIE